MVMDERTFFAGKTERLYFENIYLKNKYLRECFIWKKSFLFSRAPLG